MADLLAAVPALTRAETGQVIECEQVAQLDSKDMDHSTWQRLARRAAHHLARPEVAGVVVTHGTDTLEETAWFLHRVLAPSKPLVLVAAMRPATALAPDGPQNLLDAVTLAATADARGVLVVMAGEVHGARDVRKVHTHRLNALSSGDAGPIGHIEQGRLRRHRDWPRSQPLGLDLIAADPLKWPWVEVVSSHAGTSGRQVDALVAAGVQGLVVAGTGNGTVHNDLQAALKRAEATGVAVRRSSRCVGGALIGELHDAWPAEPDHSPWQARIELVLYLMGQQITDRSGGSSAPV